jgi:hypothetical protein
MMDGRSSNSRAWLVALSLALFTSGAQLAFADQGEADRDARIAALQSRVEKLEALVRIMAAERANLDTPVADQAPSNISASVAPPAAPAPFRSEPEAQAVPARSSRLPQELLPNLGKIGAAASFLAGAHSGPFGQRSGPYLAGGVELPLFGAPGGRVLYEFGVGLGLSNTPMHLTSNVAQVANLAVLANSLPGGGAAVVDAALAGRAPAPFAVQYDVTSRLQLLTVAPFGLKYASTSFDRFRVRPYAAAGLAFVVSITNQRTAQPDPSPFGGALIGGQIAAAPELVTMGVPSGQGGIDLGVSAGGGVEWRARAGVSFGVDVRVNHLTNGRSFVTTATRTGLHF